MIKNSILLVGLGLSFTAGPSFAKTAPQMVSGVQLLDFSGGGALSSAQAAGSSSAGVRAAMVASFGEVVNNDRSAVIPSNVGDNPGTSFVRTPAIAVPAWMRSGRATLAMQVLPQGASTLADCGARDYLPSGLLKAGSEERRRLFYPLVMQSACRYGIPVGLFDAMIVQESRYNPFALSPKGAFGLGQLMPGTAASLGSNRFDLKSNLDGAARYLASHLREFGSPGLALAAYNAGPGRVRRNGSIPRISETRNYVRSILYNWRMLETR